MGFYDNRCMVTGVSLLGSDAALVLLEEAGAAHRPIALAVKGAYDRLGSIDLIEKRDPNNRLILRFFLGKLKSGEFKIDEESLRGTGRWPVNDLERVFWNFERYMNDGQENFLNGRPIVFALICRAIWDALARSGSSARTSAANMFRKLFKDSLVAQEIYGGNLPKVTEHLRDLSAVNDFLAARKLAWKPTAADGAQHSSEEMRQYLQEARRKFKSSAAVLEGLRAYEREVSEQLEMLDTNKIDDAVLALLYLGLHGEASAWKSFDEAAMVRLHEKGYISDPRAKAKSVDFNSGGLERAEELLRELFAKRD
jgi:hypothetical protein